MIESQSRQSRFFATLLLLIFGFLALGGDLEAKSYKIPALEVTTRIQSNGDLVVEELIQYRFKGRFSYAYRTIPLLAGEEISDLRVSENGNQYRLSESEEASTFLTRGEDAGVEVRWFFRARSETRTFVMSYTVRGPVHRYPDIAELHYKFLGDGWSRSIGSLKGRVELPAGTNLDSVEAWVRDPARGRVEKVAGGILFSAQNWPRRRSFSGRVLFPAAALPGLEIEGTRAMASEIRQAEERDLAARLKEQAVRLEQRKLRQERAVALFPWMFLLPLVTWPVGYLLYMQHGKRHQVRPSVPAGQRPDQDPLFARWVCHRTVGGETLAATLFDLARRGHLQLQEEEPSSAKARRKKQNDYFFGVNKKRSTELRPFERDLLDFMTQRAGDRTGFRISDLKRVAKKSRSTFVKWFERWKKLFKEEATQLNIFEPYPVGPMVSNIFLGLLGIIVGIGVCVGTSSPAGLPALIPGALQIAFTGLLSRRTRAGERLFQEWSAFRSRIKKGDQTPLATQPGMGCRPDRHRLAGPHQAVQPAPRKGRPECRYGPLVHGTSRGQRRLDLDVEQHPVHGQHRLIDNGFHRRQRRRCSQRRRRRLGEKYGGEWEGRSDWRQGENADILRRCFLSNGK